MFRKRIEKIKISLKWNKNSGHFTWISICIYDHVTLCTSYNKKFFGQYLHRQSKHRLFSSYQLNAQFLYSITIYMLHYNPQHISSSTLLIFRRTNCTITASGIVTLCKQPECVGVCMCGFYNVWVCLGNMCTCIYCVFVLFRLCILIRIFH